MFSTVAERGYKQFPLDGWCFIDDGRIGGIGHMTPRLWEGGGRVVVVPPFGRVSLKRPPPCASVLFGSLLARAVTAGNPTLSPTVDWSGSGGLIKEHGGRRGCTAAAAERRRDVASDCLGSMGNSTDQKKKSTAPARNLFVFLY